MGRGKDKAPRKLNPRVCRACGTTFQPNSALQRYGNDRCRNSRLNRYKAKAFPGGIVEHAP